MPLYQPQTLIISGFQLINGSIVPSVAASALTIAIKSLTGADPSSSNPVYVTFRNPTAATGDYSILTLTAATSFIVSSGSTLGVANNVAFRIGVVGFNDGGTFRLGVYNARSSSDIFFPASRIASSTAEGGAGAADSAQTFYTGTAVSSKAFAVLGFLTWESGLATAGTWASAPTTVELFGPGVLLPGSVVRVVSADDGSQALNATTAYTNTTTTKSISPESAANAVAVAVQGTIGQTTAAKYAQAKILRGGTEIGRPTGCYYSDASTDLAALIVPAALFAMDFPNTTGSTTYTVGIKTTASGTVVWASGLISGEGGASISLTEIRG